MKKHLIPGLVGVCVAISASAAQPPQLTVIADGLNNPRGLAFAPNGNLYVAEAGLGAGDGHGGFAVGVGFTASITEIRGGNTSHPRVMRIVNGLASVGDTENGFPEALGPSGISVHGTGNIYVTMGQSAMGVGASFPGLALAAGREFGHLLKLTPGGQWRALADIGDFDYAWTEANKDQPWAPAGQFPDANPYGVLAAPGQEFVADAAANTLDEVRANGSLHIVAYFPNPMLPLPNGTLVPVSDAVPTSVTRGPDGYLYVGTLAFGANFARFATNSPPNWKNLPPQSVIYRVNPNGHEVFLTDSDVWASGFNPITGIGFDSGAFHVTEFKTQQSHYSSGDVVRIQINPDGTAGARTVFGAGALNQPNGIAFGRDGAIYVSNNSTSSGGGQVVRVNY